MPPSIQTYFTAALRGRHYWWHWILGVAFIFAIYFLGAMIIALPLFEVSAAFAKTVTAEELFFYLIMIASFLPLMIGLLLTQKLWHKRTITALMTSTTRFRWGYLARAMAATFILYILLMPVGFWLDPEEFKSLKFIGDMKLFAIGLIMTLIFIPFQAASEEILVRGYLTQALSKYFKWPWLIFVLTSLFFAWLHASNSEAEGQFWPYMVSIFAFGFAMCILLYFEGGLESAIGIHVANNIFAFSLVGYEDPGMPEIALWSSGLPDIDLVDAALETIFIAVVVITVLVWNRRSAAKLARP